MKANAITSKTIQIGNVYSHKLDGRYWSVQIIAVFEDRQRWGWEGIIVKGYNDSVLSSVTRDRLACVETGSKCWGWISELTAL